MSTFRLLFLNIHTFFDCCLFVRVRFHSFDPFYRFLWSCVNPFYSSFQLIREFIRVGLCSIALFIHLLFLHTRVIHFQNVCFRAFVLSALGFSTIDRLSAYVRVFGRNDWPGGYVMIS